MWLKGYLLNNQGDTDPETGFFVVEQAILTAKVASTLCPSCGSKNPVSLAESFPRFFEKTLLLCDLCSETAFSTHRVKGKIALGELYLRATTPIVIPVHRL
ncbi:MAG: hypothetical protein JXB07_05225 [Anaerolineae bacterium]|nr:hypothetical protein [Anaerolineae bacterium]